MPWSTVRYFVPRVWLFFFSCSPPRPCVYPAESVNRIISTSQGPIRIIKLNSMAKSIIQMHLMMMRKLSSLGQATQEHRQEQDVGSYTCVRKTSFWALLQVIQQTNNEPQHVSYRMYLVVLMRKVFQPIVYFCLFRTGSTLLQVQFLVLLQLFFSKY